MENDVLRRAIAALKAGDKVEARRLLGQAIRQNPDDERAWLWMSGAVDSAQERSMCLSKVLEINPRNEAARRGLAALQKAPPSPSSLETQPVPRPKPTLVQSVLGVEPPPAAPTPPPSPAQMAAAAYPFEKTTDMLNHTKTFDELDPEKRKALEGFVPLIALDLTVNHLRPNEIIDRISARGFSRKAVAQLVNEIAQQPIRAPMRYERKLTKEQFESAPSPWFTMWTSPRETIRRIVFYDPRRDALLLAALDGFAVYLSQALNGFIGLMLMVNASVEQAFLTDYELNSVSSASLIYLAVIIATCAVVGPIAGIAGLYLYGWLLCMTGRWLGGKAYPVEVRAAIAWAAVPRLWGTIFLALKLVLVGYVAYANMLNSYIPGSALTTMVIIFVLIELVIGMWSVVAFLKCLGEVNTFTAWRALGAALLGGAVIAGASMLLGCLLYVALVALVSTLAGPPGY